MEQSLCDLCVCIKPQIVGLWVPSTTVPQCRRFILVGMGTIFYLQAFIFDPTLLLKTVLREEYMS